MRTSSQRLTELTDRHEYNNNWERDRSPSKEDDIRNIQRNKKCSEDWGKEIGSLLDGKEG